MTMLKFDLSGRRCECDGHIYRWTEPRFDARGGRYRFELIEAIKPCADRFQTELSICKDGFNNEAVRSKIAAKVLSFESSRSKTGQSLADYVSLTGKWEDIRSFFRWSTTTAKGYRGILLDVFSSILSMRVNDITTADIDAAVEEKVSRRSDYDYKAGTIRTWFKVINRVFIYLVSLYPYSVNNPVRFNGKRMRESRIDEKKRIMYSRLRQGALYDSQKKQMLFAYLKEIKEMEDYRGVAAITMLESGRRPIEAGAISPQVCFRPDGEDFLVAPVFETDDNGDITNKHKNKRAKRFIPISPVLSVVFEFVAKRFKDVGVPEMAPFAAKLSLSKAGTVKSAKGFSPSQISKYVHSSLKNECIDIVVFVEDASEDSDDNRRAYILRYSFETGLFSFLSLDRVQYIMGHKRVASSEGAECKAGSPGFYASPQVQREIYRAMEAYDFAVYGESIISEMKEYLYPKEAKNESAA